MDMTVLKATQEQKESLESFANGQWVIFFIEDADGNFIIGKSILENSKYNQVRNELLALEEIPYNPKVEEEI